MNHLTRDDLTAFRARTVDRKRIEEIGAHVGECGDCTRLVFGDPAVTESVHSVWTPEHASRPRRHLLAWAAMAAFVILGIGVWLSRDDQSRAPDPPPHRPRIVLEARAIRDGSVTIILDEHNAVRDVSTSRVEWNALVTPALRTGQLPASIAVDLARPAEVLRGEADDAPSLTLIEPVAVTLESDRPTFRWTAVPEARYRVVVAHEGAPVARSGLQSGTTWQPRSPLPRGETLAWQLTVVIGEREWMHPGPDAPAAQFHILSGEAKRELEDARAMRSSLLTGLLAARHGLHDVAARELHTFASEHPEIASAARLASAAKGHERPAPTTTNPDQ